MSSRSPRKFFALSSVLSAIASVVSTRLFEQYALAEVLAVTAFLCGLALWRADRSADRLFVVGAVLGLGGLALKGMFVWLGIGAETHDMNTHAITPGNPLLLHVHHLFFNVGFLCYFAAATRAAVKTIRARISS